MASISTTGSSIVQAVAAKLGRRSRSSEARAGVIRSGGWTSTQREATRPKSGPAIASVGIATSTPNASVTPMSACSAPTAASGPGCGGTSPCMTDRPASAGMPSRISDWPLRLATSSTTGTTITTPISKKSGSPTRPAISAIAHGSRFARVRARIVSTIWSAPPESASSLPRIAPSAIRVPTPATVAPRPVVKLVIVLASGAPAIEPSTPEPMVRARKACIL